MTILAALWLASRLPVMQHDFEAAVAAGRTSSAVVVPRKTVELAVTAQAALMGQASGAPTIHQRIFRHPYRLLVWHRVIRLIASPQSVAMFDVAQETDEKTSELVGTPLSPASPASSPPAAGDLATKAYARLVAGDRRGAVHLFDAALASDDPRINDSRAATWSAQRALLVRRWSGNAYSIVRGRGSVDFAGTPVLGGGQSGGALAFALDPLDRRPVALTLRGSIAHDDGGRSALAAAGVAWRPAAGIVLAAERLIPLGPSVHGDWTVRVAGGGASSAGYLDGTAYGEAGIVGSAAYAAIQARAGQRVTDREVSPGVGAWASIQHGHGQTVDRLDLGPSLLVHAKHLAFALDYRFRVAGKAAPGSGPVLTVSAAF